VYGSICSETIVVNEETMWCDTEKPDVPDVSDCLGDIRKLLKGEKWAEASGLMAKRMSDRGYQAPHTDPYHPVCDLRIVSKPEAPFSNYRRALDFATGLATISWTAGDCRYRRECFVSRADDLIALRYTCNAPMIHCAINLQPRGTIEENSAFISHQIAQESLPFTFDCTVEASGLALSGRYKCRAAEFGAYARIILPGRGSIGPLQSIFSTQHRDSLTSGLHIQGADEVLVFIKVYGPRLGDNTLSAIRTKLQDMTESYDSLFSRHVDLHRAGYTRLKLDLGSTDADKDNEPLLLGSYNGDVSTALVEKLFNFGRYLLFTSSRPGGWPANLQGLWNGDYMPAWSSDYHNDENIQMNYWPALPGNLSETLTAYVDYYEASVRDYRKNARTLYGCRGILAPISQDVKGRATAPTGGWASWTAGAGWLAQPFFDYWLFTRDDSFLEEHAIPFLEQVALFYEDFLTEEDGRLVFSPSLSPENRPESADGVHIDSFATINATMDVAVAKEVLTNLCEGCRHLGIKADSVAKWERMIGMLPEYVINRDGAIKEWIHPNLYDHYAHRHLSHIYPLFPGFEITRETRPELFEACRIAVEKRRVTGQDAQSGWSLAHLANIYARLNEGNTALGCLEILIRSSVGDNLFTYHNDWRNMGLTLFWNFKDRIFQIDANFGFTAAVLEMLVYSNREIIGILPALPEKWATGSIEGVLCRSGAEVSIDWDMSEKRVDVELIARRSGEFTLRFPCDILKAASPTGQAMTVSALGANCCCIELNQGESATLRVRLR
jgi:alpha-L-fucosidase 2